jgi:hypothetical protein
MTYTNDVNQKFVNFVEALKAEIKADLQKECFAQKPEFKRYDIIEVSDDLNWPTIPHLRRFYQLCDEGYMVCGKDSIANGNIWRYARKPKEITT